MSTKPRRHVPPLAALGALLPAGSALAAEEGGLEIMPDPALLVALLVFFALLVPVVNALIVRPMLAVLDEREARIAGARKRADELSRRADALVGRYEREVGATRADAEQSRRAELEAARAEEANALREARSGAEQRLEGARREIATALDEARSLLRDGAEALAQEAAQRVLGRTLS